jgi:hypothetical protein
MKRKIMLLIGVGITCLGLQMQQAHGAGTRQDVCQSEGNLAYHVMVARQADLPESSVRRAAGKSDTASRIVTEAYVRPLVDPYLAEDYAKLFGQIMIGQCLKTFAI